MTKADADERVKNLNDNEADPKVSYYHNVVMYNRVIWKKTISGKMSKTDMHDCLGIAK